MIYRELSSYKQDNNRYHVSFGKSVVCRQVLVAVDERVLWRLRTIQGEQCESRCDFHVSPGSRSDIKQELSLSRTFSISSDEKGG